MSQVVTFTHGGRSVPFKHPTSFSRQTPTPTSETKNENEESMDEVQKGMF